MVIYSEKDSLTNSFEYRIGVCGVPHGMSAELIVFRSLVNKLIVCNWVYPGGMPANTKSPDLAPQITPQRKRQSNIKGLLYK